MAGTFRCPPPKISGKRQLLEFFGHQRKLQFRLDQRLDRALPYTSKAAASLPHPKKTPARGAFRRSVPRGGHFAEKFEQGLKPHEILGSGRHE